MGVSVLHVHIFHAHRGCYVEMVSDGQLSSLRNTTLRDTLAEYDRLLGVVQEVSRSVLDFSVTHTPILFRYLVSRSVVDEHALSGVREQLLSYDVAGMRGDADFAIAVRLLRGDYDLRFFDKDGGRVEPAPNPFAPENV